MILKHLGIPNENLGTLVHGNLNVKNNRTAVFRMPLVWRAGAGRYSAGGAEDDNPRVSRETLGGVYGGRNGENEGEITNEIVTGTIL